MYCQDPCFGYQPQAHYFHSNMIAPQGHTFLPDVPYNPPPPCFYTNFQSHSFPEHSRAQAVGVQNSFQSYNRLPSSLLQRIPDNLAEQPAKATQELSPDVASSLPVYFRVKASLPSHNGRRCRKSRTVFTELQLRILEKTFSEHKYLDTSHRAKIAQTLSLNETQVKTWFQNRRMKWKRESPSSARAMERAREKSCEKTRVNDDVNQLTFIASY